MPFKSDSQRKLCYLLKSKGQAGSWDCDEWSTATGKKKLPEHVKKQEEKKASNVLVGGAGDNKKPSDFPKDVLSHAVEHELEHTNDRKVAEEIAIDHLTEDVDYYKKLKKIEGGKEASVSKLTRLWAASAKVSKLAEVTTSPNRGAGDKEEGIVDHDSSEGMPKPKAVNNAPGEGVMPINSRLRSSSARKALIGATKKTFGVNPTGGSLFGKTSAKNFDFSNIGKKLDPSILGVHTNTAPVNPISQLGSTLKQVGSAMGDRAKGAITKDVTKWVDAPSVFNIVEKANRYGQVKGTQKAFGDVADAFKRTASGARAVGNAIPGMAKQSAGPLDTMRNVGAGASGAGGALYNAFSGATGNQQSYDALKEQANRPGFEQGINDWRQSLSAIGQTAKNKLPDFVAKAERFKTVPGVGQVPLNTLESYAALPQSLAEAGYMKNFLNRPSSGQTLDKAKSIIGAIPGANQVATAIGQGATNWGTNKAINYEAGRRTAGYALPVVDWMRANPWAKYMLGAGAGLLGGYALRNLFGDGGDGQQAQGNPVESAMAQGYQQQAMHQMPSNYGNMYGMRG